MSMASPNTTLDAIQSNGQGRRIRPPDLSMTDENRVPLNGRKLEKRESRLGLRGLFNRTKAIDEFESSHNAPRSLSLKSTGFRTSLAEFGGWSQTLNPRRHDGLLQALRESETSEPSSAGLQPSQSSAPTLRHMRSVGVSRPLTSTATKPAWDPPPLFQAFPQAIKTQTLSACPLSVEAMTRLQAKESHVLRESINYSNVDLSSRPDASGNFTTQKRSHRKNSSAASRFDWTKKVYVLVTSGYLLQYAGTGPFDRLPEKMLLLGKYSAAFVTDLIPGCHWVLQVSAAMDGDGMTSDSRSLFARLPFRGAGGRHASNMLMVFDGAEDMDSWIAVLRRQIESLGGKKNLSETGKPKSEDDELQLRAQASQRTLVVRDPKRFSQAISQDMDWEDSNLPDVKRMSTETTAQGTPEQSFDESSTASGASLDGRQLEGLRDSAQRLSYISSGQRTFLTSDGSSPSGSPVRDSFASQTDDFPMSDAPPLEAQLRPNGVALAERRQSVLTSNSGFEFRSLNAHSSSRVASVQVTSLTEQSVAVPQTTLNFSVPNAASKRYSLMKGPPVDLAVPQVLPAPVLARTSTGSLRPQRRSPPTTLPLVRPLSIVADQPSPPPVVDAPSRMTTPEVTRPEPSLEESPIVHVPINIRPSSLQEQRSRRLSATRVQDDERAPPKIKLRRLSNATPASPPPTGLKTELPQDPFFLSAKDMSAPLERPTVPQRPRSSLDMRSARRSRSPVKTHGISVRQRISLYSQQPMESIPKVPAMQVATPPEPDHSVSQATQTFAVELRKSLPSASGTAPGAELLQPQPKRSPDRRRSMPHMVLQGPPLAPPPMRSLPPLPKKASMPALPRT